MTRIKKHLLGALAVPFELLLFCAIILTGLLAFLLLLIYPKE